MTLDAAPVIELLDAFTTWPGGQFAVQVASFRHADGKVVEREVVRRCPAVAVIAYDHDCVWLVRQPREAIQRSTLEVPAGKVDPGEHALAAAKRELAEELGIEAEDWRHVRSYHPSSGYTDEIVTLFAATGLRSTDAEPDPGERISIERWPLWQLDVALATTNDAKTIIGLQWLREKLRSA